MISLSVHDVASLYGCSDQYIRKSIQDGKIPAELDPTYTRSKRYTVALEQLPPTLQKKWYTDHHEPVPDELQEQKSKKAKSNVPVKKSLEDFSADQREQIEQWIHLLTRWQDQRAFAPNKEVVDKDFIAYCRAEYPEMSISRDILYRKQKSYKSGNLSGLIDNRGSYRRGKQDIPQACVDAFLYTYLDEAALPIAKCYEAAKLLIKKDHPELLPRMPAIDSFYRLAKSVPMPVSVLARSGDKAFNDRYGVYAVRFYDDMASNDYWIADGHTIDVISKADDGSNVRHRLTLSAFIDARSGIYVGWVVTDNPCADATLLALRKGIMKYGIPKNIYVDNGREYLNKDIGGLGHRAKKTKNKDPLPTPILTRLGISMTNALPRNGQAKIIEREFRNFTFLAKLFDTYCGNTPANKPEKLKYHLKAGHIPTDGELISVVDDMIEGYFNQQEYNGKVAADKGLTKMDVYKSHLGFVRRASADDLNLMMLRTTKLQTIGKNGVHITVKGAKIFYFNDDLLMRQGKRVFLRYDPDDMSTARVYDENEVFLQTVPIRHDIEMVYGDSKEKISSVMEKKRRWHRMAKDQIKLMRSPYADENGHISMLDLFVESAQINREAVIDEDPTEGKVIEIARYTESQPMLAAVGDDSSSSVIIDRQKMIRNNEGRND